MDLVAHSLHFHRVLDEGVEAPAHGEHSGAGDAVEGPAARDDTPVGLGDARAEPLDLALVVRFLGVEVGDLPVERGERQRGGRRRRGLFGSGGGASGVAGEGNRGEPR